MNVRPIRKRFFLAVEGPSEQSFVTWLWRLSEKKQLSIHLHTEVLDGGGFKSMLQKAIRFRDRSRRKGAYSDCFLLVDRDRASQGDWPIQKLREEAGRKGFQVWIQTPNHEGLLFRLTPGREREIPTVSEAEAKLKGRWPEYQKPMNANDLERKFSLDDLLRLAAFDADLATFMTRTGLLQRD